MAVPVSFRWDEGFVARIDAARGDVPRARFVRRAVEFLMAEQQKQTVTEDWARNHPGTALIYDERSGEHSMVPHTSLGQSKAAEQALEQRSGHATARRSAVLPPDEEPAPAEQPREYKGHIVRSSSARPFRPAPKGKA